MPSDAYNRFFAACEKVGASEEPEIVVSLATGEVDLSAVEDAVVDGTCLGERMYYAVSLSYIGLLSPKAQECLDHFLTTHPSSTITQEIHELVEARHVSDLWDEEEAQYDDGWPWDDDEDEDDFEFGYGPRRSQIGYLDEFLPFSDEDSEEQEWDDSPDDDDGWDGPYY